MAVSLHLLLFPLKAAFWLTIPDVHQKPGSYWGAIVSCILWMAILCFVMITCCDFLGGVFQIDSVIMGLTIGAVGTSFPNVFASVLVAKQLSSFT